MQSNLAECLRCPLRQRPCSGSCACIDGHDIMEHAAVGYCPHTDGAKFGDGKCPEGWVNLPILPSSPMKPDGSEAGRRARDERTRTLWRELHGLALIDRITPEWLGGFLARVPCGDCGGHAQAWVSAHPLPMTGQFAWSVDWHNDVNRSLGKGVWTVAEARAEFTVP